MGAFDVTSNEGRLSWTLLAGRRKGNALPEMLRRDSTRFVHRGRNALFHGLAVLDIEPGQKVLVPAYVCGVVVDAIRAFGAQVVFYRIRDDCAPDVTDLTAKIDERTRAVVVIHYFGFPAPIEKILELCETRGLFLIEDCAHVLAAGAIVGPLGCRGHISVFSFGKFLPVYDGGSLVVNVPLSTEVIRLRRVGWEYSARAVNHALEKLCAGPAGIGTSGTRAVLSVMQAMARKALGRYRPVASGSIPSHAKPTFDLASADLPMTGLSRRMLGNVDLEQIVRRRRDNYHHLLRALGDIRGIKPLYRDLPNEVCPWMFPVLSTALKDLHKHLRARGVEATAWDGVVHPSLPLERFREAAYLYSHLVFLPVHQDLTVRQLDAMVAVLREVLDTTTHPYLGRTTPSR